MDEVGHVKSSGMSDFFAVIGVFMCSNVLILVGEKGFSTTIYIMLIWETIMLFFLYYNWIDYYVTANGIQRKYFGIFKMSDIPWREVRDVARVPARSRTLLFVSTIHTTYPLPDKKAMRFRSMKMERDLYKFRCFYLKDTPEILDCIYKYHGKLSDYAPKRHI